MELAEAPLVLILLGLIAYAVLAGADFGAGFWQLLGGRGERAREIREYAHHAMGPVWEANHVWLIFILVVCWTAYPEAFGSIASTLSVPLFVAGLGIILRGTAYALRAGTATAREQRTAETVLGLSSVLTPFALGAAIGGIASGRVPVGNAEGDLVSSWLNPTSVLVGTLAVATAAYMAAVYLAADAGHEGRSALARAFRVRALATAVVAGAVAIAGLGVVRSDAESIWDGLTSGAGLACVLVSIVGGLGTVLLVWAGRFQPARATAALAVAAIVAGWGFAQSPTFLPGLTIEEAAAGRSTLIALLVSVVAGAVVLFPALGLLFGLKLRGRFDEMPVEAPSPPPVASAGGAPQPARLARAAGACLLLGCGLLLPFDSPWTSVAGAAFLLAFVAAGSIALAAAVATAAGEDEDSAR